MPDAVDLAAKGETDSGEKGPQGKSPARSNAIRQPTEEIGGKRVDDQVNGMDRSGEGSPPTEFGLKGFEEDSKSVKEPITRGRYETGGHNDPAVEKSWFIRRIHGSFDSIEKAIRRLARNQEDSYPKGIFTRGKISAGNIDSYLIDVDQPKSSIPAMDLRVINFQKIMAEYPKGQDRRVLILCLKTSI